MPFRMLLLSDNQFTEFMKYKDVFKYHFVDEQEWLELLETDIRLYVYKTLPLT